uniref:DUF397 domain-containing protein n=1 Tax=Saccharopolyspora galaxeae TaxID=2781241 RepID=UPI0027DE74D2|nr:DUF397 domain-containing protein [Saccharopolyspora sp. HNM0986]
MTWRKSSRSASSANCVEVAFGWRKSTRSATTANCVEVALGDEVVGVRDSKDPDGGVLVVPARRWAEFVGSLGVTSVR